MQLQLLKSLPLNVLLSIHGIMVKPNKKMADSEKAEKRLHKVDLKNKKTASENKE